MSENNGGGKKIISWDDCLEILNRYRVEYTKPINAEADVSGYKADVSGCEVAPGQIVISKSQEPIDKYTYSTTLTGSSDGSIFSGFTGVAADEKKWMAMIVDCKGLDGFIRGNYYELTGKQMDFNGKFYYGVINENGQTKMLESSIIRIVCVN